ncbi:MAG: hypothetical protein AB7G35_14940 [Hyphomicrobiaceae bacterium]
MEEPLTELKQQNRLIFTGNQESAAGFGETAMRDVAYRALRGALATAQFVRLTAAQDCRRELRHALIAGRRIAATAWKSLFFSKAAAVAEL